MTTELLTVGALRRQFAHLPDDAPVLVQAYFKDRRSFRQPVVGAEIQAHPETEQPSAALLVDWSMPTRTELVPMDPAEYRAWEEQQDPGT